MPIIAATALNPCIGDFGMAFANLEVSVDVPVGAVIVSFSIGLDQLALSVGGRISPATMPNLALDNMFWTPNG